MTDYTTIQTFPVPEEVGILQDQITSLADKNKLLRRVLIIIIVFGAAYGMYITIKNHKKDEPSQSKNY